MRTAAERAAYIDEQKRPTGSKEKLWARDSWNYFDVYTVPVDGLILNVDNRRFRAERIWAEHQLGHPLDPENTPTDERSIETLLLASTYRLEGDQIVGKISDASEALQQDWERRKQESPLWIRPNGVVRNGNRRLAMIKRLQRDGGDLGLQYVEAIILTQAEIDEAALLEMEQREQITENFKVRYGDINYLLAVEEAADHRNIDWFDHASMEDVAGELQGMTEKSSGEVLRDLYAIKYMNAFLEDSGQPGQYQRVPRTLETFRDIGRMMMRVELDYPLEYDQALQVLFAAVRAGRPYGDIRTIRAMFRDNRPRFNSLVDDVEDAEAGWSGSGDPGTLSEPTVITGNDSDEEDSTDDSQVVGPDVENYPKEPVANAIKDALDAFATSKEDDSNRIIREILNRMQVLDDNERLQRALEDEASREKLLDGLTQILEWAELHRGLVEQ